MKYKNIIFTTLLIVIAFIAACQNTAPDNANSNPIQEATVEPTSTIEVAATIEIAPTIEPTQKPTVQTLSQETTLDSPVIDIDSLEFMPATDDGLEISVLNGNPAEGPSTFVLRIPANYPGVMHTHEASYSAVVIRGNVKHIGLDEDAATAPTLGVGDSWYQPADEPHLDLNPGDEPAIVYINFDGPLDLTPHEEHVETTLQSPTVDLDSLEFMPATDDGLEISVLSGNPAEGPSTFVLRIPANYPGVMHTHEANYSAVVIRGNVKHIGLTEDAATAPTLGVGDSWYQPADEPHLDLNPGDEPAIVYINFDGPLDLTPHEEEAEHEYEGDGTLSSPTVALDSLEFMPATDDGLEISVLSGNPAEGPSTFVLRIPANYPGVMHTHEASYSAVVIRGNLKHIGLGEDAATAPTLGVGDSWYQPADEPHLDLNPGDEPAIVYINFDGPLDLTPHEEHVETTLQSPTVDLDSLEFMPATDDGLEISVLSGNPAEGPSTFVLRIPANYPGVMHTHEANYSAVVIRGNVKHIGLTEDAATAPTLGVGDSWYQPADEPHLDLNPGDEPAIVYINFDGPLDLTPHEEEAEHEYEGDGTLSSPTVALDSLEFMPATDDGLEISVLSGNPAEGPSTFVLRIPANYPGVMHTHEASYSAVVIRGNLKHIGLGEDAATAPTLGVGDSWYQPADEPHLDLNPGDEPAIVYINFDGPLDLTPHEEHVESTLQSPTVDLDSLEFMPATNDGLEIAVLSGNPAEGPSTFMLRIPANYPGVMHTHEANYSAVVIRGNVKHIGLNEDPNAAPTLTVGDSWYQPADEPHLDFNPGDEPAIVYIRIDNTLDLTPYEE